ncbi:MAG TPA: glycosyltransferase [Gemmatimonadales bacterium]|nr:glycosyltransferase [Gemmatimonadales bacterium]
MPRLQQRGVAIALEGERPARLAVAMDAQVAAAAYAYAVRARCPLIHYVWDLPPWRLGRGRNDWVWFTMGRYVRVPRLGRRYAERPGYYSRLRFVATRAREVWVPSALTATSVRERWGLDPRHVPFCFDSDRFTLPPPPRAAARPEGLISVSRLTAHKDHAAVLRAAARFQPMLPVRLVGSGPEREPLARLAAELGVPCRIESGLSPEEMVTAYQRAEVVVCPSRFEGFGLTPMEAIACGRPVVVSDIPPHREFLGTTPHYFPLGNDDALFAAIRAARTSPPPAPAILEGVRIEAAVERFSRGLVPYLDGSRPLRD